MLQAVGKLEDHDKLYLVVSDHTLATLDEIRDVVIRADTAGVVRLRDLATVKDGFVPQWIRVVEDGKPAVLFNVYEQPDGNAVQIAAGVKAALSGFKLPHGVVLKNWYDQSELVVQSATSVRDAVLIGLALSGLVVLIFLRNLRVTLIAMIVVPATLATTILLLGVLKLSFNIMTLGGIAAAVGLVIDDAIVMVEHIARRAAPRPEGARGDEPTGKTAVMAAAREFMTPLTGSSLATLIVFIPLSFLSGVTGAFSKALSVTMGCALVVSYLMTAFVVPVLARSIVDFSRLKPETGEHSLFARAHTLAARRVSAGPADRFPCARACRRRRLLCGGPCGDGVHAAGRRRRLRVRLLHQARHIADRDRSRDRAGRGDHQEHARGRHLFPPARHRTRRRSRRILPRRLLRPPQAGPCPLDAGRDGGGYSGGRRQSARCRDRTAQLMEDLIGDLTAVPQPIEIKLTGAVPAVLNANAEKWRRRSSRWPESPA